MSEHPKYMDWHDFDIEAGSRVSYVVGGRVFTATVREVVEDKEKNMFTLTLDQFPDGQVFSVVNGS